MDRRTKRQKLQAMANQNVSPNEAEVAKEKLKTLPPDPPKQGFRLVVRIIGLDGKVVEYTVNEL